MRTIFVMGVAALVAGCVTTDTVHFNPNSNQQALVRDGVPAMVSRAKKSIVTIRPAGRGVGIGGRPVFIVGIQNMSQEPLQFRVADVAAVQQLGENQGYLKVYSYEELATEERNAQVARAIVVGLAAGANAYGASRHGYWAQARAADQNADLAASVGAQGQANMAALEALVIKDHTLLPGEQYGGQIHLQPPSSDIANKSYTLSIVVGAERHEFAIAQSPSQT